MKLRILVLDDDPDIRNMLEVALSEKGHEVKTFSDPTEIPFFHDKSCPCRPEDSCADALLADIVMPHVEGIDFLKSIKTQGCWPLSIGNVAIISGYLTLHYMNDLNDMDVQYFRKPFQLQDIYNWADDCVKRLEEVKKCK